MSNPWNESSTAVTITPLTYLLASIRDCDVTHVGLKAVNTNSCDTVVQSLRMADEITQKRRDLKYRHKVESMYSETTLTNNLVEELDFIFRDLTRCFDSFHNNELLKNAYENSVYVSITTKDNLGEDNRIKLVKLIRTCINAIKTLKESKIGVTSLNIREEIFADVLRKSGILEESKSIEDFSLDDLFSLITECNMQIRGLKDFDAFCSE